jgi:hypothetical protein
MGPVIAAIFLAVWATFLTPERQSPKGLAL